jgi:nicotinamidase-related amidase
LIIIDLQRAFTDRDQRSFVPDAPAALRNALRLLHGFRKATRPVAFSTHAHPQIPEGPGMGAWWSSFVLENSAASELDPSLVPHPGELVFRKQHYSAFRETPLEAWLKARAIDTLVLCGTMTHICVDTSARDAFMCGFDVLVVSDACASKHRALHESSLQGLSHAVARLATTDAVMSQLEVCS